MFLREYGKEVKGEENSFFSDSWSFTVFEICIFSAFLIENIRFPAPSLGRAEELLTVFPLCVIIKRVGFYRICDVLVPSLGGRRCRKIPTLIIAQKVL